MYKKCRLSYFWAPFSLFLFGCSPTEKKLELQEVSFEELSNFKNDSLKDVLPALQKSCAIFLKYPNKTYLKGQEKGSFKDWGPFCKCILNHNNLSSSELRSVIQKYLKPYKAYTNHGEDQGVFTGYFEPLLRGSFKQHGKFQTPLYRKPNGALAYLSRAEIVAGALNNKGLEIVFVDDSIDAFFFQIQGSGRVQLENGEILRLAYDSGNKKPYTAIGKVLIDKGYLVRGKDTISMQTIVKWLKENKDKAEDVMSTNESYVFFKEAKNFKDHEGPKGAHGVPLTCKRSIAIDSSHISYGTPLWVDLFDENLKNIKHLMVAQDTGGAIKGPIRGDYFWGYGISAKECAGVMNARGAYYLLLPK
ncbi:MAG: MltA domain-containing protein [Proteobacteria bacterium]|nr:MltA domain-containing protein [Pseudomonadota bacterium]